MKRFLNILFGIVVLLAMAFAVHFVNIKQKGIVVQELEISIRYVGPDIFLRKADVEQMIADKIGDVFTKNIVNLEIKEIESLIARNPYVWKVPGFTSINGRLLIDIIQTIFCSI